MSVDLGSAHGSIVLDAGGVTRGVNEALSSLRQMESGTAGASRALEQAGRQAQNVGASFGKISTAMLGAGGGLAAGLGLAVKTASDFEHQMSAVGAVSDASAGEMQQLRAQAIALGQDITLAGVSAADAALAEEELAKGGISVADQLGGATKGALLLASAGALDFGEAANIAANALNTFNLKGADLPHVADLFAAAANASTIEVHDLGMSLSQVGLVAAQFHQTIEQTTATLAAFGAAGLRGSDAGTSLKTAMLQLVAPSKEAQKVMQQYGLSFFDANGQMKSFRDIAEELRVKLGGLTDQQRQAALATLVGTDGIRALNVLYKEGGAGIDEWIGKVNQAGSAAKVGAERNNNLQGSIEQLKGSFEAAQIAAGQFVIPDLRRAVDQITELINGFNHLDPAVQKAIVYGAAATAGFLLLGGSIIKTTQYARDLKDAVETVIGAFGRKEAAKKSLTAANETLAGSMKGTSGALGTLKAALPGVAVGIGEIALVTAAAAGAVYATGEAVKKYNDATGNTARETKAAAQAQDAMSFAVAHGFDAMKSGLPTFSRWLEAQRLVPQSLDEMNAAWDRYIDDMNRAGLSTQGLARSTQQLAQGIAAGPGPAQQMAVDLEHVSTAAVQAERAVLDLALAQGTVWQSISQANEAFAQAAQANDTLSRSYHENQAAAAQLSAAMQDLATQQALIDATAENTAAMQRQQNVMGPLTAAYDQINAKRAQGLPLTAEETFLAQQIPGALAQAQGAYQGLALAQADYILQQQQLAGSSGQAGAGFSALQGTAGALQGQLDALRASAIQLDGALGALGTANSKLAGEYNILGARIDVLNAKKKESGGLSAAEAAELEQLTAAQKVLGDQMGENAAKQREIVLAQIDNAGQTKAVADQVAALSDGLAKVNPNLGQAADGLVGLTDGFGNVAQKGGEAKQSADDAATSAKASGDAAATAAGQFDDYGKKVAAVPDHVTTLVDTPGLDEARIGVDLLSGAIGNVPKSFTVTAIVDTSAAIGQIEQLNRMLPHSPAEEGPFSELPNWDALFEIAPAAARGAAGMREGVTLMRQALDTGLDEAEQEAAKKSAELVQAVAGAVKAAEEALAGLTDFRAPEASRGGALVAALRPLIRAFVDEAQQFLDESGAFDQGLLDAGNQVAQTAQSVANAVKAGVDALGSLRDFAPPAEAKVAAFVASLGRIVLRIGEVAATLEADGVADAAAVSENAQKVVSLLRPGAEGFTALTDFRIPSDEQITGFGERLLRIIVRIGEIGNLLEVDGVRDAAQFSQDAAQIVGLLRPGAEGFTALTDFKVPSDEQIQVFGERLLRIVVRIGEIGTLLEQDGVERAGKFSEGAGKVVAILSAAKGFSDLATLEPPSDAQIDRFVDVTRMTVQRIARAAATISQEGVEQAGVYGENAAKAVGLVGAALSAFRDLKDFVAPSADAIQGVVDVATFTADRLIDVARAYDPGTLDRLGAFSDAAGRGFSALKSSLDAAKAVTEAQDAPDPAAAVNGVLARFSAGLGPLGTLAAVAAQWQTLGAGIRGNLTQAFGDLGASLAGVPSGPGGNPQALGLVAGAAVVQRSEITVTLQMPADDGQFVARSLRVDGKSRHEVADLVAAEIAAAVA